MDNNTQLANAIPDGFDKATAFDLFSKLLDYAKETTITQREIARYSADRDRMVAEITCKYQLYHELLIGTFKERSKVIDKHFEVIDQGIKDGDNNLISIGLRGLSDVVKESPFRNIQNITDTTRLHNMLESGELSVM